MKIGAIIVLFNPDKTSLRKCLNILSCQVDEICLVDNSALSDIQLASIISNSTYIPLHKNVGIAAAQNIGIKHFIDKEFDYLTFCDQDSMPNHDTVRILSLTFSALSENGYKVGAVGTTSINKQTNKPYAPKSKQTGHIAANDLGISTDVTECYSVRSSISYIATNSFLEIGGFEEGLFIDGVDHEWCWRAWHKAGMRSFIADKSIIYHQLGEGDRSFARRDIAISSTFRVYYQFRNYLWLCRRDYVPRFWKKKHLIKYAVKAIYFPSCVAPRWKYLKGITKGIIDGFLKAPNHIIWQDFQKKKNL